MIVELKKTKITKSIVQQSLMGSYSLFYNWEGYDILGWCMIKSKHNIRWTLLYKRISNQIIIFPYISNHKYLEIIEKSVQKSDPEGGYSFPLMLSIKVYCNDLNRTINILEQTTETKEEMEQMFEKCKQFLIIVDQKGQIYL